MTDDRAPQGWAEARPITGDQFKIIAKIILNWGHMDYEIKISFDLLYGNPPHQNLKTLINKLNIDQKLKIIPQIIDDHPNKAAITEASKELIDFILKHKWRRNIIAHGVCFADGDGERSLWSSDYEKHMPIDELTVALENSRMALSLAENLNKLVRDK